LLILVLPQKRRGFRVPAPRLLTVRNWPLAPVVTEYDDVFAPSVGGLDSDETWLPDEVGLLLVVGDHNGLPSHVGDPHLSRSTHHDEAARLSIDPEDGQPPA
jgi:hypothetical protein